MAIDSRVHSIAFFLPLLCGNVNEPSDYEGHTVISSAVTGFQAPEFITKSRKT